MDFGGTLVDLSALPVALLAVLGETFAEARFDPQDVAQEWIRETANRLPRAQGPHFVPEKEIAAEVLREVLLRAGRKVDRDAARRMVREAWDRFGSSAMLQPDVTPRLLESFRERTAGLVIVSDGDDDAVPGLLSRLGIAGLFDAIVTSESVRAYKPSPAVYRAALEAVHAIPSRSLFVSDSVLDLVGGVDLGIRPVLVQRAALPRETPLPQDSIVLSTLESLGGILQGYEGRGRLPAPVQGARSQGSLSQGPRDDR